MSSREQASVLWNKCMEADRSSKHRFKDVVTYMNENRVELKSYMNCDRVRAIKLLIVAWNKDDKNIEDYLKMKDYHAHFNGNYPNEDFNQLWSAYITPTAHLRIDLMKLNSLCRSLH